MKRAIVLFIITIFLTSCHEKTEEDLPKTYDLSGYAQKGPFVIGSEVTIIELNSELDPTGKVFFSTIESSSGFFTFPNVEFDSKYVQLKVEGRYFNEIEGYVTSHSIILKSIVDISDNSTVNVNVITHLVQARAFQLVNEGIDFNSAYNQAFKELLELFFIENNNFSKPENLDLTISDSNEGVLLFVSSLIQSQVGAKLTFPEYFTMLTIDFKDNGVIDNAMIRKALGSSGMVLDIEKICNNLISRFSDMGEDIHPYIGTQFVNNFNKANSYTTIFDGLFPINVDGYKNIANSANTVNIEQNQSYALAINSIKEEDVSNVQIKITSTDSYSVGGNQYWSSISDNLKACVYGEGEKDLLIPLNFTGSGSLKLDLYFATFSAGLVKYPTITVNW